MFEFYVHMLDILQDQIEPFLLRYFTESLKGGGGGGLIINFMFLFLNIIFQSLKDTSADLRPKG